MSETAKITDKDLSKLISEEIKKFVVENKAEIVKRAQKRLRASGK
jgi:hypothetical protein